MTKGLQIKHLPGDHVDEGGIYNEISFFGVIVQEVTLNTGDIFPQIKTHGNYYRLKMAFNSKIKFKSQ